MTERNFLLVDRDMARAGSYDTFQEAVDAAKQRMGVRGSANCGPYRVFKAVAKIEAAIPPVTVTLIDS